MSTLKDYLTKLAEVDTKAVDLTKRMSLPTKSIKAIGKLTPGPSVGGAIENIGKNRIGIQAEPAPRIKSTNLGPYTTSGTLTNPKVAHSKNCDLCMDTKGTCTLHEMLNRERDGKPLRGGFLRTKLRGL